MILNLGFAQKFLRLDFMKQPYFVSHKVSKIINHLKKMTERDVSGYHLKKCLKKALEIHPPTKSYPVLYS